MTEKKSFGIAFALWLFFGGFGIHRIYIKENPVTFIWYWLAVIGTLTIIVWVDLFRMKTMIEEANKSYESQRSGQNDNI